MEKEQETIKLLKEYNQEHIIKLLEKLDGKEKEELINQINNIDFHQINELYQNTKKDIEIKENKIESIQYLDKEKLTKTQKDEFDELGEKEITSGKYAVVTMAGGQGTRLGHTGPKGTFKLDVYGKGKYLFEILAENLKDANKKYNTIIPWYIMTSKENNDQTQEFLEKNNYFGYDRNSVMLFEQGELPLVDTEGKMLISKDLKIKEASDGNGGVFSSLRTTPPPHDTIFPALICISSKAFVSSFLKYSSPFFSNISLIDIFSCSSMYLSISTTGIPVI